MIKHDILDVKPKKVRIALAWLFPFMWFWAVILYWFRPPIKRNGIHVITGVTGGGKTLLAHTLSLSDMNKGYTVYSNSRFNSGVKYIEIEDYFDNFEQKKPLENGIVIFDEIQRQFNKRQNRRNDYNEIFVPLIEWLTTHRHNGVPRVYFLTQSYAQLDVQLQNLIHNIHVVTTSSLPDFKVWLRSDKWSVTFRPFKVFYFSKKRSEIDKDDIQKYIQYSDRKVYNKNVKHGKVKYKKTPRYYAKIDLKTLLSFNTYAFKRSNFEKPVNEESKETEN